MSKQESTNSVRFIGLARVNKGGVKARALQGNVVATSGWNIRVDSAEGRFMTSMQVKTLDGAVARALEAAGDIFDVTVEGYIKSENWAPKDAPSNWVTVFYATEVVAATPRVVEETETAEIPV